MQKHVTATIPVCIDQIENQTGRIQNFENAAKKQGEHSGIYFDDSDVYKALEGIAYTLVNNPDPALEQKADEWIDKFVAAQEPDGYINTYYTLTGLENRWTNMVKHEMYCAGHMMEAAVAYYKATGKRKLLDVSERMAQHMMTQFGPGKRHWVPGHEEIELALVKLYQVTGKQEYLDFSEWLLNERGHGYGSTGGNGNWNAEMSHIIMLYRMMRSVVKMNLPYSKEILMNYMEAVAYFIITKLETEAKEEVKKQRGDMLFHLFMDEVRRNYTTERQLSFYADKLCITSKYLSRIVKQHSGRQPSEWIRDYVILESKALLRQNNLSVQQISDMLNFPNPSFFGKYFKTVVGCSPRQYQLGRE